MRISYFLYQEKPDAHLEPSPTSKMELCVKCQGWKSVSYLAKSYIRAEND